MKLADFRVNSILNAPNVVIPPGIKMIGADQMWGIADKGRGNIVAIIDTGVDRDHPDLRPNLLGGRSFVPGTNPDSFDDENGHGTHVAGTICANGRIMGAAPEAKFLSLKVFGPDVSGSNHSIAEAYCYAAAWRGPKGEKVDAISASLGGPGDDPELHRALAHCVNIRNILCPCAAGNEGDDNPKTFEISYPAAYHEAFSVGAIDFAARAAAFTNANDEVDVAAPGDGIVSCFLGGQYANLSGTSMATPHVAGLALLYIGKFMAKFGRKPTENELYILMKAMTKDVDALGIDANTGAGLVQSWI